MIKTWAGGLGFIGAGHGLEDGFDEEPGVGGREKQSDGIGISTGYDTSKAAGMKADLTAITNPAGSGLFRRANKKPAMNRP